MRAFQALGMTHHALVRLHREATRNQEVAGVPVGDLDDIPRLPEVLDRPLEHHPHRVEYGRSAISRAFLMAKATSRWCCTQFPVTRRARILPRSLTNFR